MPVYILCITLILTFLTGGFLSAANSTQGPSKNVPYGDLSKVEHKPYGSREPSNKADYWHNAETHVKGPGRSRWEADLHVDTKRAKPWTQAKGSNLTESTKILVLPLHAAHLRQVLQFFFLKARFPELKHNLKENEGTETKLDYIVTIAEEVQDSHPHAWACTETNWDEVDDDALFGKKISLYNDEFIDFWYAANQGKEGLRQRLEQRVAHLKAEKNRLAGKPSQEQKPKPVILKPKAVAEKPNKVGFFSSWLGGSAPVDQKSEVESSEEEVESEAEDFILDEAVDDFFGSKQKIHFDKEINQEGSLNQLVDRMFKSAQERFLLKYIDSFNMDEGDKVGINADTYRLGIVDQGRESFLGIAPPSKLGKIGSHHAYNPNFDLIARFVIDFRKVKEDDNISVWPITKDINDRNPTDDWQKDWPDSAGIRFSIDGANYDVYFPIRWASVDADRSGLLGWDGSKEENTLHSCKHSKICHHPDGFSYIDQTRGEPKEALTSFPAMPDKGVVGVNYGYYELQTPKILTAFQDRPLNAVWSVSDSSGLAGSLGSRMLGGKGKDMTTEFASLEHAKGLYDYPAKFELMWDGRACFYPPEKNVFDLSLYKDLYHIDGKHYKSANQCLADVNYRSVFTQAQFEQLLVESKASQPFFWQDQEGACHCRDWRAQCHKKGRSCGAVSKGIDKSVKLSTPSLHIRDYHPTEVYGWTPNKSIDFGFGRRPALRENGTYKQSKDLQILRAGERVKIVAKEAIESLQVSIEYNDKAHNDFFFDLQTGKEKRDALNRVAVGEVDMILPPEVNLFVKPNFLNAAKNVNGQKIKVSQFNDGRSDVQKGNNMRLTFTVQLHPLDSQQYEVSTDIQQINRLDSNDSWRETKRKLNAEFKRM